MKIRIYKQQVEDAEELAALNLTKYKRAQKDIEDAGERANIAEKALSKSKSKTVPFENAPEVEKDTGKNIVK